MTAKSICKSYNVGEGIIDFILNFLILGMKEPELEVNRNAFWLTISTEFPNVLGFDFCCGLSRLKRHNGFAKYSRRLAFFPGWGGAAIPQPRIKDSHFIATRPVSSFQPTYFVYAAHRFPGPALRFRPFQDW